MSDETEKLNGLLGFTPQSAGIDRDAIIFAAGQASVKKTTHWKYLASLLAGTQALTLALFLMPVKTSPQPGDTVPNPGNELVQTPLQEPDPSALWFLHQHASEGMLESTSLLDAQVSSEAPLSMRSRPEQIQ